MFVFGTIARVHVYRLWPPHGVQITLTCIILLSAWRRCLLCRIRVSHTVRTLFIYVKCTRTCQTPYNLLAREWPAPDAPSRCIATCGIFNWCLCKVRLLIDSTAQAATNNVINAPRHTVGIGSMAFPIHRISGEHYSRVSKSERTDSVSDMQRKIPKLLNLCFMKQ